MHHPLRARIDLAALRRNYRQARRLAPQARALAVVKADAYGHGAVQVARALDGEADGFAVACLDEALELRDSGIRAPIVLLDGVCGPDELPLADRAGLIPVIHARHQLDWLRAARPARPFDCWLKLDSGLHRLGFAPEDFQAAYGALRDCPHVASLVLMTHFSRADEPGHPRTGEQIDVFARACAGLGAQLPRSLANSAALLTCPRAHGDWTRPGLMIYGVSPLDRGRPVAAGPDAAGPDAGSPDAARADARGARAARAARADAGIQDAARPADLASDLAAAPRLDPVMTLESAVIAVRELADGEPVGYGERFRCEGPRRIGTVAIGYADGYPRQAPTGTPVAVDGQPTRLVGRVSMDLVAVDLTGLDRVGVGSTVELWGARVPVAAVAGACGTIPYELLTGLGRRVRRHYP